MMKVCSCRGATAKEEAPPTGRLFIGLMHLSLPLTFLVPMVKCVKTPSLVVGYERKTPCAQVRTPRGHSGFKPRSHKLLRGFGGTLWDKKALNGCPPP